MIIQEMNFAEKKKIKINTNFSAAGDQRLAADKKRSQSTSSLRRHLQCIVGKTMDFPALEAKRSEQLRRSKLTSRAREPRAGLIRRLANRD